MKDDWPVTVAMLPPGGSGCMGVPVDGPGKLIGMVNSLCRGCLRYTSRKHADRIMPTPEIKRENGTVYCALRIWA